MDILKILLMSAMISGCSHTLSEDQSGAELAGIPEFESLVGNGMLEIFGSIIESESISASIILNENYTVKEIGNCTAFTITTLEKPVLSVASCEGGSKYIFCGNSLNNCANHFKTRKSGNSLSLIKDLGFGYDKTRFLVEFSPNKIIYRIQGEDCLIGYPHGCIIDGFKWLDEEVYTYVYRPAEVIR